MEKKKIVKLHNIFRGNRNDKEEEWWRQKNKGKFRLERKKKAKVT